MKQPRFSAPEFRARRSQEALAARRRRFLLTALGLSAAAHVGAVLLVVLLPRVLPREARPLEQGTVELLMVEQTGAARQDGRVSEEQRTPEKEAAAPAQPAQPSEPPASAAPVPPAAGAASVPLVQQDGEEPAPLPGEQIPQPGSKQADARPIAPPSREAPVFNLEGTESDSNAIALGPRILPAMPDNRFRNRPPAYPIEAERRGQRGAVVVMIHVSANGSAVGVDVNESSGVDVLDKAAVEAVRKWHFHPAMQSGRAIPFDMPFRFIFEAD